jgi:hypothetical protein
MHFSQTSHEVSVAHIDSFRCGGRLQIRRWSDCDNFLSANDNGLMTINASMFRPDDIDIHESDGRR